MDYMGIIMRFELNEQKQEMLMAFTLEKRR